MSTAPPDAAPRPRLGVLLAVGTAAGLYSGLFGVGGGSIMVPLLILLAAHDPRTATATSLAAITVIAAAGALAHLAYGNVDLGAAAILAAPAVVGAVVGAAVAQRVPRDALTLGLAALLVVGALDLLLG